jgi:hypothetical protein
VYLSKSREPREHFVLWVVDEQGDVQAWLGKKREHVPLILSDNFWGEGVSAERHAHR